MDPVRTRYLDRDGAAFAYQVVGEGPADVVAYFEINMHLDLCWTDPDIHHLFERGSDYSRTVYFQRRGFGLSEPVRYSPTVEQQADDIVAVMDELDMRQATLVGIYSTSWAIALVAARHPERVKALVLVNPNSQGFGADDPLHGWESRAQVEHLAEEYRHAFANWGSGQIIDLWDPVLATAYNHRLAALLERCSATPAAAQEYFEWVLKQDLQDVMRAVQVPTRVLRVPSNTVPEAAVRHVADLIEGASFHMLPATPPGASLGEAWLPTADHIEEVATGVHHSADADRFLGTVLFTDVVSSTELLSHLGDATYRHKRAAHERLVRLAAEQNGGHLVDAAGDGTLSVFDGPSKAVRCAETIRTEAAELGISVRAGIHTGELERDGLRIAGITVHIGARVGAAAGPGEVLVSRTVHDLVAGSGLTFASRGQHELKGVPGVWELFEVTHAGDQPDTLPEEQSMRTPLDRVALQGARRAPALTRAAVRLGNAVERRRARAARSTP